MHGVGITRTVRPEGRTAGCLTSCIVSRSYRTGQSSWEDAAVRSVPSAAAPVLAAPAAVTVTGCEGELAGLLASSFSLHSRSRSNVRAPAGEPRVALHSLQAASRKEPCRHACTARVAGMSPQARLTC